MQPSDSLHKLIHSLSKDEKRRFKLAAGPYRGSKKYLELFDAINAQAIYDEEHLKRRFASESFVRSFHVAKNYLYNLILKSLAAGELDEEPSGAILREVLNAQILAKRLLHEDAAKALRRARERAETYEAWEELLLIERAEAQIERKIDPTRTLAGIFGPGREAARTRMELVDRRWRLFELYGAVIDHCLRHGYARTADEIGALNGMIDDPLLDGREAPRTAEEELLILQTRWFHALATLDVEGGLDCANEMLALFEKHPRHALKHPALYASMLHNYAATLANLGRYDAIPDVIAKLESTETDHFEVRQRIFANTRSLRLWYHIYTGTFEEGDDVAVRVKEEMKSPPYPLSPKERMYFHYQIAYIRFALGRYTEAIEELERILTTFPERLRSDLQVFVRMLLLLSHLELGNIEQVSYGLRSLYRWLHRRKGIHRFEAVFLRLIRKLANVRTESEEKIYLREAETEIEELMKEASERHALNSFDFLAWLEGRRKGTGFGETVRRKLKVRG